MLVEALTLGGLAGAVLCPGSRSTPIAAALSASDASVVVGLDEREAAFFALGWAKALRRPVAVVTTSGTAALELVPALAEAREAGVALVAIVADRPRWAHGVGAAQTVEQAQTLASVASVIDLELSDVVDAEQLAGVAHELLVRTVAAPFGPGPCVLNLAIAEPLLVDEEVRIGPWHPRSVTIPSRPSLADAWLAQWFDPQRRGWLVVGEDDTIDVDALASVAAHLGWPVLADPLAGVERGPWVLEHPELVLRSLPDASPEVVLVLGAPHASRVVAERIAVAARRGIPVAWIQSRSRWRDPARLATTAVVADVGDALRRALLTVPGGHAGEPCGLCERDRTIAATLEQVVADGPTGEVALARVVLQGLHDGESLVVASSLPIRHLEVFGGRAPAGVRVLANRGLNGIDGTLATWLGVAHASRALSVLVVGDLTALYGLSALWQLPLPERGLVVVLENQGGVIFDRVAPARLLDPTTQRSFFVTPPRYSPGRILEGLGHEVMTLKDAASVKTALSRARAGAFVVARVGTTREATNAELDRLYQAAGRS
ncbi:2-oxoglutarate decarboxylase [Acidimicrobium ferrooxidans DSM 10331]|uniref:2-succinyl-5-enolpyruvyl-6-hydroxy-3-cyclohexene-1-carboxylate synthase n=1 Tax=Acidimicrobium ferrooxidans (strain DSM 10331 / JCM 15462 / NBRC 103882 / ICP) TaxID=525909 RepID=C7M0N4_ACIFD|nr:2-oxoglutarate decarboxylase [Acidimicrobium ferrooxidans DSM 10331]